MPCEEKEENEDLFEKLQSENGYANENNTCKSTIAQFIAGWTVCLSALSLGTMMSFPTLLIGEFRKPNQDLHLSEDEASWIGSLIFLLQPFCSVLGGLLQTYVGRKYGMILIFIPQLIGWLLLSLAKTVISLYIAVALFGISVGAVEAPAIAYLGEITQPRVRGRLTASVNIFFSSGYLLSFLLGSIFTCRTVATICICIPVISIVAIYFIPDSPIWLLSRGRNADALKALCWLRGWVSSDRVQLEYKNMGDYIEMSKNYSNRSKSQSKHSVCNKLKDTISTLTSPAIRKPFILISICHFTCHNCTLNGMRPYFIEVLDSMSIPIQPEFFTFVSCILMLCGGVICFLVVKYLGKRVTLFLSLMICSLICITLSWYTFYMDKINVVWIPMASLLLLHLILAVGAYPIPWMLTSELFPFKLRSLSTGLIAASCYIQGFIFTKSFYGLKNLIHLSGCFLLYGVCGICGSAYLYFKVPETEGKTLAEIEKYFSVPTKKQKPDNV